MRRMSKHISASPRALDLAREVLGIEAAAVQALVARIDGDFLRALDVILQCEGRVIVSGMGKSGHIARKIAATLSSTGTPAYFVHPGEASHGDLGMITSKDVIIALSYSGESDELMTIVPVIKRQGAKLISMTGNPASSLAQAADVHLDAAVDKEACPMGLAPTASTTAALAHLYRRRFAPHAGEEAGFQRHAGARRDVRPSALYRPGRVGRRSGAGHGAVQHQPDSGGGQSA